MSKALRLSERWFRLGLWLVALVFASFLIGLGGNIVANLPRVEHHLTLDDFLDRAQAAKLRATMESAQGERESAQESRDQANLRYKAARADSQSARETFNNWLATRHATQRPDQDAELIRRTKALESLKEAERQVLAEVQVQDQRLLDQQQAESHARQALTKLEQQAYSALADAQRQQELRVFLYRLALTLPLLAVAGWLFVKKRQGSWWPFVWGYIYFALFTFFVELVPYLPSYGGWVRYTVGIAVTVAVGRYAILALNRYLERQKQVEAMPDIERRKELSYDVALARLGKKVCPGCERAVDLSNTEIDYCPHCGICLFDRCAQCQTRKCAFSRFCHACGAAPQRLEAPTAPAASGP